MASVEQLVNAGRDCMRNRVFQAAEHFFRQALKLIPNHAEITLMLVDALQEQNKFDECLSLCRRVWEFHRNQPEIHIKLGNIHASLRQWHVALRVVESGLIRFPGNMGLCTLLGRLHHDIGNVRDAKACFQRIASFERGKPLWNYRHLGTCPAIFADGEQIDQYYFELNRDLDMLLDSRIQADWRSLPQEGFCPSFHLPHHGRSCREVREKFGRYFQKLFPHNPPPLKKRSRIRVGFHVVHGHEWGFFRGTGGIMEQLDEERFEVVVICNHGVAKQCSQTVKRESMQIVTFDGSFEQITQTVRQADCDILFYRKAGSDPASYFFPFTRPAPIQATSYGTHGTSGIPAIQYFLSSSLVEQPEHQIHYTEQLYLMDDLPTYQKKNEIPSGATRSEFGLPERGALYFCPHRLPKYHPEFDGYLREILACDPNGHILLLAGNDLMQKQFLEKRLHKNLGDTLMKRVIFLPKQPVSKFYRIFSLATMILDSSVYAGGLTSFDTFLLGVPEVTLSGPLHVQNFATGIYRRMGWGDHKSSCRRHFTSTKSNKNDCKLPIFT